MKPFLNIFVKLDLEGSWGSSWGRFGELLAGFGGVAVERVWSLSTLLAPSWLDRDQVDRF